MSEDPYPYDFDPEKDAPPYVEQLLDAGKAVVTITCQPRYGVFFREGEEVEVLSWRMKSDYDCFGGDEEPHRSPVLRIKSVRGEHAELNPIFLKPKDMHRG